MTDKIPDDDDKSFFGWAKDPVFLGSIAVMTTIMTAIFTYTGLKAGYGLREVLLDAIPFICLVAGVVLLLSCLRWFFRLRYVAVFFTVVGAFLGALIGGIAQLFAALIGIAISLAIFAGIAGLLLFGIRQLF